MLLGVPATRCLAEQPAAMAITDARPHSMQMPNAMFDIIQNVPKLRVKSRRMSKMTEHLARACETSSKIWLANSASLQSLSWAGVRMSASFPRPLTIAQKKAMYCAIAVI